MTEQQQRFVFIITYGRSGSTLVQKILQSIPGYFIRGENKNTLYELFGAYEAAMETRYVHGKKEHEHEAPWFGAHDIVPERFATKMAALFVEEILQPPLDARVVGFKEIRFPDIPDEKFEPYLNFLHRYFPGCKFIFNSRRWRDVAQSGWWKTMDPALVEKLVKSCDARFAAYMNAYPGRGVQLHYEEITEDVSAIKALFDFLGEPMDAPLIDEIITTKLKHPGTQNIVDVSVK